MRAKFINEFERGRENPLDSLEIGRVLERQFEKKIKELTEAVTEIAEENGLDLGSNDLKTEYSEGYYIQVGFIVDEILFGIVWSPDFGLNAIMRGEGERDYIEDEIQYDTTEECQDKLRYWVNQKGYRKYLM
jgi:hypothetical protein